MLDYVQIVLYYETINKVHIARNEEEKKWQKAK